MKDTHVNNPFRGERRVKGMSLDNTFRQNDAIADKEKKERKKGTLLDACRNAYSNPRGYESIYESQRG